MPNTIRIPTPMRKLTNDQELVQASGANVGELIEDLEKTFPGIKERLCDQDGNVRRFVNIFLNDEDIRFLGGESYAFQDGDEVMLIPSIAGGSGR